MGKVSGNGKDVPRTAALALAALAACSGRSMPPVEEPVAEPSPARVAQARGWAGADSMTVSIYFDDERTRGFVTVGEGDARWTSKVFPMWKAEIANVDGDAGDELVLGVWSRTKRHDEPEPHRAVWVLDWNGTELAETWRGSALARPLIDFEVADLDGDGTDELLSLERSNRADGCYLTAYRWNGFGFAGVAKLAVACNLSRPLRAVALEDGRLVPR